MNRRDTRQHPQHSGPRGHTTGWLGFLALVGCAAMAGSMALATLTACETQKDFEPCVLDKEVTDKGVCNRQNGSTDTSSCVVKAHPQCDKSICLSYFGLQPVCTYVCTSDADCGADAKCWTYAEAAGATPAQRYCLPNKVAAQAAAK